MADQPTINQSYQHKTGDWVEPGQYVDPTESLRTFGQTYGIHVYDSPGEGRIPKGEYLDMLCLMYESLPTWDLPFKQDGSVDLAKMKVDFKHRTQREHDVCWGTCEDGNNCPPPKRDNRCMVWVCHKVSENEPKPKYETWPIGKPMQ